MSPIPKTFTGNITQIFNDISKGIKTPITSFKSGSSAQRSTGGFGVVATGLDLFSSASKGEFLTAGNALTTLEGAASLAVVFSANPYLLFGVSAWFVGKALFNAVTKGLPELFKGNFTEASMVLGKSALDVYFNCSALKIFKEFGVSKILNTGLAPRGDVSKLLANRGVDDAATAAAKLTQTTTTIGNEVKAATGMVNKATKATKAIDDQIIALVEKEAAAKLATETAKKAATEAAEQLAKNTTDEVLKKASEEASKKFLEATAKQTAIEAEKKIANQLLNKSKAALENANKLLANRQAALLKAEKALKSSNGGTTITDEVIEDQRQALYEALSLNKSGFAHDLTVAGFGKKQAVAAARMARGTRAYLNRETAEAAVKKAREVAGQYRPSSNPVSDGMLTVLQGAA